MALCGALDNCLRFILPEEFFAGLVNGDKKRGSLVVNTLASAARGQIPTCSGQEKFKRFNKLSLVAFAGVIMSMCVILQIRLKLDVPCTGKVTTHEG